MMTIRTTDPSHVRSREWDFGRGLRGYRWEAGNSRANLLLQHGFCEYSERYVQRYNALVPHLVEAGVSVHAFDMRGHGRSPGARAVTDVRLAVEDHLAARRLLQEQPLPLFLMGHSLGGLVTAASVARDANGVHGVVLSSPLLIAHANPFARWTAKSLSVVAPRVVLVPMNLNAISRIPEEVRLARVDPLFCKARGVSARLAYSSLETVRATWRHYPQWQTPVLVFHGTADKLTDVRGSKRFIDTVAATDKTLRLFEGGYHEVLNDLDRDEALELVVEWLVERVAGRSWSTSSR